MARGLPACLPAWTWYSSSAHISVELNSWTPLQQSDSRSAVKSYLAKTFICFGILRFLSVWAELAAGFKTDPLLTLSKFSVNFVAYFHHTLDSLHTLFAKCCLKINWTTISCQHVAHRKRLFSHLNLVGFLWHVWAKSGLCILMHLH